MLQACALSVATSESYHTAKLEQTHSAVLVSSSGALEVIGSAQVHHGALMRRGARGGSGLESTPMINDTTGQTSNAQGSTTGDPLRTAPCDDEAVTGLCLNTAGGLSSSCYSDVQQAKCADLADYCFHEQEGHTVRDMCKRTCGFCDLQEEDASCVDGLANDEPRFAFQDGRPCDCSSLEFDCRDPEIKAKCKRTCGGCATTTKTPVGTNTYEEDTCSRRRRMGFCWTRRRESNPTRQDIN